LATHFKGRKLQKNTITFFFSTEKVPQGFEAVPFTAWHSFERKKSASFPLNKHFHKEKNRKKRKPSSQV
jgi:hypothetical protein